MYRKEITVFYVLLEKAYVLSSHQLRNLDVEAALCHRFFFLEGLESRYVSPATYYNPQLTFRHLKLRNQSSNP